MVALENRKKEESILEMIEQMEEMFFNLRFEYLKLVRDHDEAQSRIEELEAETVRLYESLEELEND